MVAIQKTIKSATLWATSCLALKLCCALSLLTSALILACCEKAAAELLPPTDHHLRIEFYGEQPFDTDYLLKLEDDSSESTATFSDLKNYTENPKSSSIFCLDKDENQLMILGNRNLKSGVFTIRLNAPDGATVSLLRKVDSGSESAEDQWKTVQSFQINELIRQERISFEDQGESTNQQWNLQILKTPAFFLENWEELSVFDQKQKLSTRISIPEIPANLAEPCLALQIRRVDNNELVHDERFEVLRTDIKQSGLSTIVVTTPAEPGVYEANLTLIDQSANLWSRFKKQPKPSLSVQRAFIVSGSASQDEDTWTTSQTILPAPPFWLTPDWLNPTKVNIPSGLPLSPPSTNEIKWERYLGESITVLPPNTSFESDLNKANGKTQIHSLRIPSDIKSDFEVKIGNNEEFPVRQFRITPDPNADLIGPWQTITWMHDSTERSRLNILNPNATADIAFESIIVESKNSDTALNLPRGDDHRHVVLRVDQWDWIDDYSKDFHFNIDESEWSRPTVELYRLHLALKRLIEKAKNNGFDTVLISANLNHLTLYRSQYFAHCHKQNTHHDQYLDLILSFFDKTHLGLMIEFTPDIQFPKTDQLGFNAHLTTAPTSNISSNQKPDLIGSATVEDTANDNQSNKLTANSETVQACLAELSQNLKSHPCFTGMVINLNGSQNHFTRIRKETTNPDQRVSINEDPRVSESNRTKRDSSNKIAWQERWQSMVAPIENVPTFFIQSNEDPFAFDESSFVFIDQRDYTEADNLSRKLALQESNKKNEPAHAVLFTGQQRLKNTDDLSIRPVDISQTIERQKPHWILIQDNLVDRQFSDSLIQNLRHFSELPNRSITELKPIDASSATVRLWSYTRDDYLHLFVVNLVPWVVDIDIETLEPLSWMVSDNWHPNSTTNSIVSAIRPTRSRFTIFPGRCVSLKATISGRNSIRQWSGKVSGGPEVVKRIKAKITDIVENAGRLNQPSHNASILSNGGFEKMVDSGIVGWLHAQHPAGCVNVDSAFSSEGSQSIRLVTEANNASRTWLMSETFPPPKSGRLAVALSIRGTSSTKSNEPHQVRIAIETSVNDEPYRISNSLKIPDDGDWSSHEMVIEVDGYDPKTLGAMRIAIDSLKPGTIWIDDVRIYDYFPTEAERTEIQRKVFLAVQGMQRGNLLPAGQLLNDFWVHDLLSESPNAPKAKNTKIESSESSDPSVAERIKDWLPQSLRF